MRFIPGDQSTDNSQAGGRPNDPWDVIPAKLMEIDDETPGVRTYHFEPDGSGVDKQRAAMPGQFNMIYAPGVGEAAISISGKMTHNGRVVHTIREVGNVTGVFAKMSVGASVGLRGPFGSIWPLDQCTGQDMILVGGGIGVAPLRPVIYELVRRRQEFGDVHVLIGSRSPADLLFNKEYARWQDQGINIEVTVDRADSTWVGDIGVVTQLLDRLKLPRANETTLMTCGPEVMMMYAIQSAISRGLSRHNIWLALERNMNCAVGTCGHCQFGPHFICKDGPVLRFDRVEKLLEVTDL